MNFNELSLSVLRVGGLEYDELHTLPVVVVVLVGASPSTVTTTVVVSLLPVTHTRVVVVVLEGVVMHSSAA